MSYKWHYIGLAVFGLAGLLTEYNNFVRDYLIITSYYLLMIWLHKFEYRKNLDKYGKTKAKLVSDNTAELMVWGSLTLYFLGAIVVIRLANGGIEGDGGFSLVLLLPATMVFGSITASALLKRRKI